MSHTRSSREKALWKSITDNDPEFFFHQAVFIEKMHGISILDIENKYNESLLFVALKSGCQEIAATLLTRYESEPSRA